MFIYDDEGNIIDEVSDQPQGSVLSQYMGKNARGKDDYWYPQDDTTLADPEAEKMVPKFRTMNLDDIKDLADPEWLVEKYLSTDSFGIVFGPPGSTKSFWVLDMGLCIAAGIPFNGHETKQGHFLYSIGEGLRGLKWRIESWLLAHPEVSEEQIRPYLHIIPDVPHLLDKSHVARLHNTAEAVHNSGGVPLRMAVVDTWARSLVGGDENSQKDAGIAIDACERVRKMTGSTVVVVHHTGADGLRERGSTALRAAADTSIMINHDEQTKSTAVIVKKMKDGESGMVSRYQLKNFGHSVVLAPLAAHAPAGMVSASPTVRDRDYYQRRNSEDSPF